MNPKLDEEKEISSIATPVTLACRSRRPEIVAAKTKQGDPQGAFVIEAFIQRAGTRQPGRAGDVFPFSHHQPVAD